MKTLVVSTWCLSSWKHMDTFLISFYQTFTKTKGMYFCLWVFMQEYDCIIQYSDMGLAFYIVKLHVLKCLIDEECHCICSMLKKHNIWGKATLYCFMRAITYLHYQISTWFDWGNSVLCLTRSTIWFSFNPRVTCRTVDEFITGRTDFSYPSIRSWYSRCSSGTNDPRQAVRQ